MKLHLLSATILLFQISTSYAGVIHNETINGELSNNQAAPNTFILAPGTSSIIGSVQGPSDTGPDPRDWVTITIPSGFRMTQLINAAYASGDVQGFIGFQTGPTFVGAAFNTNPALYNGFTHFGTGAQNGSFPAFNSIGVDLLPIMLQQSVPQGAQGFTIPLAANDYSFIIQQTSGALTGYQFDFVVEAVPEPSSLFLVGLGGAAAFARWRRRRSA